MARLQLHLDLVGRSVALGAAVSSASRVCGRTAGHSVRRLAAHGGRKAARTPTAHHSAVHRGAFSTKFRIYFFTTLDGLVSGLERYGQDLQRDVGSGGWLAIGFSSIGIDFERAASFRESFSPRQTSRLNSLLREPVRTTHPSADAMRQSHNKGSDWETGR